MAYKLVLRWKDRREERPLGGTSVRLGRDATNEIVIDAEDRSVSRFHARLDFDGRLWRVVDTQSRNRVQVNGRLIPPGEPGVRVLADGDTLLLGSFELQLVREESEIVLTDDQSAGESSQTYTAVMRLQDLAGLIEGPGAVKLPKQAEQAIDRAKKALMVLTTVGARIAAVTPVDEIIDAILDVVFEATPAERAALLLWEDEVSRLVPKRARTRAGGAAMTMTVSQSLVRDAFEKRAVVQMDPQIQPSQSMYDLRLRSAVGVPLLGESRPVGVIYADTSLLTGAFDPFGMALLSALASHTAIALEQSRLLRKARQEERWREQLERYLPRAVVDRMLAAGGDSHPGLLMTAEEAEATVLFCDMAGFTSRTEDMEPAAVLLLLNRCFSDMTEVIQDQGGTVDKYIGDALMAVFGAPLAQADHARRAALAALGLRDAIRKINAESVDLALGFRIGMHSGKVIAGDVGHVTRRNWTVLGSTVNLASRMESSVAQPGQIVLTGDTRDGLGDEFELRPVEILKPPKGIKRGFQAFELLGLRSG